MELREISPLNISSRRASYDSLLISICSQYIFPTTVNLFSTVGEETHCTFVILHNYIYYYIQSILHNCGYFDSLEIQKNRRVTDCQNVSVK